MFNCQDPPTNRDRHPALLWHRGQLTWHTATPNHTHACICADESVGAHCQPGLERQASLSRR